jgi:excisionase family DNA binding protein
MLTVFEVAEQLKVSAKTIRLWIETGKLTGYRFGKDYRISKEDLEAFIESSKIEPENK